MNARAWALVGVRAVGLVVAVIALPVFVGSICRIVEGALASPSGAFGTAFGFWSAMPEAAYLALGLYLFFGGRWVARQVTRGLAVPGMCPGCGYDVRGLSGSRCPECAAKLPEHAVR